MPFHLSGTIRVAGEDIGVVRAALPEHIRLTRAETGCMSFEVWEREHGVFSVKETFADEEAFKAHQRRILGTDWAKASARAVRHYKTWVDDT